MRPLSLALKALEIPLSLPLKPLEMPLSHPLEILQSLPLKPLEIPLRDLALRDLALVQLQQADHLKNFPLWHLQQADYLKDLHHPPSQWHLPLVHHIQGALRVLLGDHTLVPFNALAIVNL